MKRSSGTRGSLLRHKMHNAVHYLKKEGGRRFLFKALREFRIYHRLYMLSAPLKDTRTVAARIPLHFRGLSRQEAESTLAWRHPDMHAYVREFIKLGLTCHGAWHEQDLAAVCWTRTDCMPMSSLDFIAPLAPGEVYFFDAFTHPDYRGKAVQPALCEHIKKTMSQAGHRLGLRSTLPDNRSALRAHAKSGFVPYALIGRMFAGPFKRYFVRPITAVPADSHRPVPTLPGPECFGRNSADSQS